MPFYVSVYLFVVAFYLLTASGRIGLSDGVAMLNVAQSMVDDGSLSSEPCKPEPDGATTTGATPLCIPGTAGRFYAGFGIVPSLAALPAVLGARSLAELVRVDPILMTKMAVSMFTLSFAPLVCVALAMWILKLGYSRRTALFGALVLAFASPFWWNSVKGFFSEPFFTLALVIAACSLSAPRSRYACALSGLAFGVACGARLFGVILFPAFILSLAFHGRERGLTKGQFFHDVIEFSLPFSACALVIAWANYARFGSPLKTGYHLAYASASDLLSNPFLHGIYQLLFNGEVGLLIFAPWVLLAGIGFRQFMRAHRPEAVLGATIFTVSFLFFAKAEPWHGGWVVGPRYLVPTLPFLVMMILPFIETFWQPGALRKKTSPKMRQLATVLVLAGFLVQSAVVVFPTERYYTLMGFYQHKPVKPWWAGSIPFASIDYLSRITAVEAQSVHTAQPVVSDQFAVIEQSEQAWAVAATTATEEDFLGLFPNSENMRLPNLMLMKVKLMGLPAIAGFGYLIAAFTIGLVGFVGLRRSTALQ